MRKTLSLIPFFFMISPVKALNIVAIDQLQYSTVLKTPASPVLFPLNQENKALIDAMKHKLQQLGGVGLAAPQVNCSKRIIAVYIPNEAALLRDNIKIYPMHILINPTYQPISKNNTIYDFEACYSVNDQAGKIPRFNHIRLTYQDERGKVHQKTESGFYARVLQHEIDHLNGFLITDRFSKNAWHGTIKDMMVLRRAELSEEKQVIFDKLMAKKLNK